MPNTHATLDDLFSDIADKIRSKTGQSGNIVADNFPTKINEIVTPILQSKSATPGLSAQTITPTSPNNGLSSVSISAITKELLASLDADFAAENIKKDVDLFGLIGTLESGGEGDVVTETINFAEETSEYTVTHNKGKIPKYIIVYPLTLFSTDTSMVANKSIASVASPTHFFSVYYGSSSSTGRANIVSVNFDWTNYGTSSPNGVLISLVTNNSFVLFPQRTKPSRAWEYRWIAIF